MSLSSNFPTSKPSLNLDFANVGALDPRITFTRSSSATYTNSLGLIATAATNVARFDYDPVTLAARGLLVEESRTNLLTYSEDFTNAAWSAIDGLSSTITANAAVAPDGTTTAEKIVETAVTGFMLIRQTASLVTGTNYTVSFFAKAAERSFARILFDTSGFGGSSWYATFNLTNGTVSTNTSATITAFGNGWYRCSATAQTIGTGTYPIYLGPAPNATIGYATYGGVAGSGIFIWGAQLEAGSFATSYIPTVASTVTRSADVASVNTLSPWWNETEGTFLFDFNQVDTVKAITVIGDDTFSNSLRFNIVQMARGVGSGFANIVELGTAQNGSHKLAVAIKLNDYAGVFDGGAVSTDTSASLVPSPNVLGIGRDYGTNGYMNGWMRRLAYYPVRLTNAQLQALTS